MIVYHKWNNIHNYNLVLSLIIVIYMYFNYRSIWYIGEWTNHHCFYIIKFLLYFIYLCYLCTNMYIDNLEQVVPDLFIL